MASWKVCMHAASMHVMAWHMSFQHVHACSGGKAFGGYMHQRRALQANVVDRRVRRHPDL